jgi:hypothetical protein
MRLTRRELAAAGVALGAGCLSGDSNVRYPAAADREGAPTEGRPLAERDPTAAAGDAAPAARAPPNGELATVTRGIFEEVRWFATEYEAALRGYRDVLGRAGATVERVHSKSGIDENTLGVIERAVERVLAYVDDRIEPHFGLRGYVESNARRHVEVARTFAGRGDIDRAQEELRRLEALLENLASPRFVARRMAGRFRTERGDRTPRRTPTEPIRNRLLTRLRVRDGDDDDDDEDDGPDELFEVWDATGPARPDFTAYAYAGPSALRERRQPTGPFDAADQSAVRSRFEPAVAPAEDRRGLVYVLARRLPSRPDQPDPLYPERYPANAAAIQAFDDVAAASAARTALIEEGPVTAEGTVGLGRAEFDRIYYPVAGDVVYAFLVQAGAFLVLAGPSETAWNERVDWARGLERSWLHEDGDDDD